MTTEEPNFAVTSIFYPEWWNVNTHRCNHINRTPLFQANYGLGRALFADWGRVGAVKVQTEPDGVKVTPQITVNLVKKLRRSNFPVPVFSPFYASSVLSYTRTIAQIDLDDESTEFRAEDEILDSDFSSDWFSDPIAGDQAAAALLCDKLYTGLRRNRTIFTTSTARPDALFKHKLNELERLADMGRKCDSTTQQNAILHRIQQLLKPCNSSDATQDCGEIIESSDEDDLDEFVTSPKRRSNLPIQPRNKTKRSKASNPPQQLPPFIKNLLSVSSSTSLRPFRQSHLLTGLDPLLIRLAGRRVNPVFQGNGLLCTIKQADTGSGFTNSRSPVLLWSPPKHVNAHKDANSLFMCNWSPSSQDGASETCYLTLPTTLLPGSRMCELDASFASQSTVNVVSRWTEGSSLNNAAVLQLTTTDQNSLLSYSVANTFQPELPGRSRTVCLNPWLINEWALAGTHFTSSGDRMAFVHLYSMESTESTNALIWSCRVVLDDPHESSHGMYQAYCEASELTDSSNTAQLNLTDLSHDPRFSTHTDNSFECASFPPWLRIGFGQDPSQLCLTTNRRMLVMDTRQAATAQLLFRFASDAPGNTLFSVADQFTSTTPRFLADVYVLAGTVYNLLLLDKRMPLRPVLHAAHSLFGEPTYLDWTVVDHELRDRYDLPQVLVTMCAQNPPGVACVGLNLTSPNGAQLVGPSCAGEPLTKIVTGTKNDMPTQLLASKTVMRRLQSTYCGLTNIISQSESGQDALCGLTLTGMGDMFMHKWIFTPENDDTEANNNDEPPQRCCDWLSELRCDLSIDLDLLAQFNSDSLPKVEVVDLMEKNRMSDHCEPIVPNPKDSDKTHRYWSFSNLAPLKDFQPTSKVVHSTQRLVHDLWSAWNGEQSADETNSYHNRQLDKNRLLEEQLRRAELDSYTESAKNRIRRFKHILERITCENPGSDDDDDNLQSK